MLRNVMILILLTVGCTQPEDRNAPPIGSGGSNVELPEELELVCDRFFDCSVACSETVFGNAFQTESKKLECLALCETPSFLTQETISEWGEACSVLVFPADESFVSIQDMVCEEGLELCYEFSRK